jgi:hypothetical protein
VLTDDIVFESRGLYKSSISALYPKTENIMRLFYQSPRPQRRPIDHQAHSRHQMPPFYDPNNRHFNYPIPYGHPYDSSCLGHYQAPPPYVRMQSPFPPPPIKRTHTPPPPNVIYIRPQTPGNQLSRKIHSPSKDLIYEIRESDVLCGRGAPSQYQTGNKFFRETVERFQSSYIAARRIDKPEIATHIVDLVRERGGRFLKRVKVQGVGPSGHFCWYVQKKHSPKRRFLLFFLTFRIYSRSRQLGKISENNVPTKRLVKRFGKDNQKYDANWQPRKLLRLPCATSTTLCIGATIKLYQPISYHQRTIRMKLGMRASETNPETMHHAVGNSDL